MLEDFEVSQLVNKQDLEKVALATKVGQFLKAGQQDQEKATMQALALKLAEDINASVRAALAFEVRSANDLDPALAEKIAFDIRDISEPFLKETVCFTDEQLAVLIPKLGQHAQLAIAKRKDLGEKTVLALVSYAGKTPVTFMIRAEDIFFPDQAFKTIIKRFDQDQTIMDYLSRRSDLPLEIIEDLIARISTAALDKMVEQYDLDTKMAERLSQRARYETLCDKILSSTEAQVHTYVLTLKDNYQLNFPMIVDLADRGSFTFLISSMAVLSGLTKGEVKQALWLDDRQLFVNLMIKIKSDDKWAKEFLRIAKHYNHKMSGTSQ